MLIEYIPDDVRSISIIGISKNAGKTTVFNQLLQEFYDIGTSVGCVSAGLDGEKADAWSGLPKPPITVQPGTLAATSRLCMEESNARFRILEKVKESAIGHEVFLLRTMKGGQVKLTGTPSLHDIKQVMEGFHRYQCTKILIDGAYDRIAASNPAITDGVILVVGASYHRSMEVVIEKTRDFLFRHTLPVLGTSIMSTNLPESWRWILGALTNRIIKELIRLPIMPTLIIADATRLLADSEIIRQFYRLGGRILVKKQSRILAVCINPFSPDGYVFDGDAMLKGVKEAAGDLPVIDVMRGRNV